MQHLSPSSFAFNQSNPTRKMPCRLAIIGAIALDVYVNLAHIKWMDTSKDFVDQKVADIDNTVQRLESLYFNSYVAYDTQSIYTQVYTWFFALVECKLMNDNRFWTW